MLVNVDCVSCGVLCTDNKFKVTYVNKNAESCLGKCADELAGLGLNDLFEFRDDVDFSIGASVEVARKEVSDGIDDKCRPWEEGVLRVRKNGNSGYVACLYPSFVDARGSPPSVQSSNTVVEEEFDCESDVSSVDSTTRLNRILLSMATPVVVCDTNMKITYANPNALETFGYTMDELFGQSVNLLMNETDAKAHDGYVSEYLTSGQSKIIGKAPRLVKGRQRDGEILNLYLTITTHDHGGFTAVFTDVTEQMRQQSTLDSILSSMPAPVVISDIRMCITYANPCALQVFGYTKEELLGQNVRMLMGSSDAKRHNDYVQSYKTSGNSKIIGKEPRLVRGRGKNGKVLSLYLTLTRQDDGFTAVFADVTEQTQASARLDNIFNSMATPVIVCDSNMLITYANPNALDTFGYTLEELRDRNITLLMNDDDARKHDGYVGRYRRTGSSQIIGKTPRKVQGKHRSGADLHFYLTITTREVGGFTAVFTNVTEQVRQTARLENILASMKAPVVISDPTMSITYINPNALEVFGYDSADELIGRNVTVLMNEVDARQHEAYVDRFLVSGTSKIIGKSPRLVQGKTKSGQELNLYLTITRGKEGSFTAVFTDVTQQTRQALRLENILKSIRSPVVICDADMRISFVNYNALQVFGYSESELIGRNVTVLMTSSDAQKHDSYVARYESTNQPRIIGQAPRLVEGRDRQGNILKLYLTITKVPSGGYTAVFSDITSERRQVDRLTNILQSMYSPVIITDLDMKITYANPNSVEVFGYTLEEMEGRNVTMLMNATDARKHDSYVKRYEETAESMIIGKAPRLVLGRKKDGAPLHLYLTITAHEDGYTAVFTDITVATRQSQQLKEILRTMASPVVQSNEAMEIIYVNKKTCEVFGFTKEEMIGKNVKMLMNPDDSRLHDEYVQSYVSTGKSTIIGKSPRLVEGLHKDGFTLHLYLAITAEEGGGFTAVFTDVTQQKRQSQRMLLLFESLPSPVVVSGTAMLITYANPSMLDVFGYSEGEVLGQNVTMLMNLKDAKDHDTYVKNYENTGEAKIIGKKPRLVEGRHRDGTKLVLYLTVIKDVSSGYTAVLTDVTRLAQETARASSILSSMNSPVVICNKRMQITFVNESTRLVFGYDKNELLGANVTILMNEMDGTRHDEYVRKYRTTGQGTIIGKAPRLVQGRHKLGQELQLYLTITQQEDGFTAVFTDVTEQMRGSRRMNRILATLPCPVVSCDDAMRITYVNQTALTVFGYSSENELLNNKVDVLMQPEDAAQHDSHVQRYRSTGIAKVIDKPSRLVRGRHRNGAILHLHVMIYSEKVGFTAIFNDVTPLIRQTERMRRILSSMKSPVVIANKKMRITYVNANAEQIFGYSKKELFGRNVTMLMNSNDAPRHDAYVKRYEETKESSIIGKSPRLVEGRHKLGYTLYLYLTITAQDEGYTAVFIDVTEQNRDSERIQKILSSMPSPVVSSDADMRITYMNPNGLEVFGYELDEVLGKNVTILMNPHDAQEHHEYVHMYRQTGRKNIIGKSARLVEGRKKDGSKLHLYLTVNAEKVGFTAIFTNVTGLVRETDRMGRVLSSMKSPVVIASKNMVIMYVNQNTTEVFGYTSGELIGHSVNMLMNTVDSSRHDKYVDRFSNLGTSTIIGKKARLVKGRHKLGYTLHLYLTITEQEDTFTAVFTDVSEETKVNQRIERILSSMPSPVVVSDGAMEITYVNPSALDVFGYSAEELLGQNVTMLMNPNDASRHDIYVDNYISTGSSTIIGKKPRLVEGVHKDGSSLFLYLTVTAEKVGFTAIFTDVTSLVHERTRASKILSTMNSPVVVANAEMTIQYVNAEALKVFGYETEDKMLGKNVTILMGAADGSRHQEFVEKYLETHVSRFIGKRARLVAGRTSTGDVLQLYLSITESGDGTFTAVFTDVTEAMKHADRVEKLETMASPVFVTNKDLIIEYANPFAARLFDFREDELINHSINIILKDVDGQHSKDFFAKYASESLSHISAQMASDNEMYDCVAGFDTNSIGSDSTNSSIAGGPLFTEDMLSSTLLRAHSKSGRQLLPYFKVTSTDTGYTIVLMDVTQEIAATNQLTSLMKSAATCIILADAGMKIEYVNPFASRTFGYTARELVGKPLSVLSVELASQASKRTIDMLEEPHMNEDTYNIGTNRPLEGVAELARAHTKRGNILMVQASITRTHDRYTFVLQDVTKTHTLVHKLNAMLQATPTLMMIFVVESPTADVEECNITLMSRSCWRIVNTRSSVDEKQASKRTLRSFVSSVFDEHRGALKNILSSSMKWKAGVSEKVECRLAVGDRGDECAYDAFEVVLTKLEHNEVFVSARNIESDIRLREELRGKLIHGSTSLKKAKADSEHIRHVFGYVAHEYRNMYFGAHVLCEDLKKRYAGTSSYDDLEQVLRIHTRMGQLFDDVLLMQKIESNEYEYVKTAYDLAPLLEDIIHVAKGQSTGEAKKSRDVVFSHKIARGCEKAVVVGSPTHLFQAVTNLLSNAFRYNTVGGTVKFSVKLEEGPQQGLVPGCEAVIEVRDTGVGIPEGKMKEIFQPYKRLTTGSHRVGSGLGLTFAREFVVRGNSGKLSVRENIEDGKGTVFEIRLPVYTSNNIKSVHDNRPLPDTSSLSVQRDMKAGPVTHHDCDVLVVDDDDIVRSMLARRLSKSVVQGRKVRVMEATNGEEALQLMLEEGISFALVTVDQDMGCGHYNGTETIKCLRDGGFKGAIAGITGSESESDREAMQSAGAKRVLLKGSAVVSTVLDILAEEVEKFSRAEPHERLKRPT